MADTKKQIQSKIIEREYVIPLKKEWVKVPKYKRTAKSIKAIKEFIARHMRIQDRDKDKVKLDVYLNNELWFRGSRHAFNKIKVKVIKDADIVKVLLAEEPDFHKFLKAKQEKIHRKVEKVKEEKQTEKTEEKLEEKVLEEEKKKAESEKEMAVAEIGEKVAERAAKAEKHLAKGKGPSIQRMALKK